jgi:N-glycosylase/DNA lyase
MNLIENNKYSLIAYDRYLELNQIGEDTIELSCDEAEYNLIWKEYFDMNYDYDAIVQSLQGGTDDFLKSAAEYGKGIRILRQEPFEAMISFIISQNKNIPAIKNCIEAISRRYGERRNSEVCGGTEYYTFPAPEVLAKAQKEDLRELKTGYRDEYIIRAAQAVAEGTVVFEELKKCSYDEIKKSLKGIHGIGEKVANCITLYGLHRVEVFPVDVWIARVMKDIYQDNFAQELYEGYAGIIQQYMFYYMRYLSGKSLKE